MPGVVWYRFLLGPALTATQHTLQSRVSTPPGTHCGPVPRSIEESSPAHEATTASDEGEAAAPPHPVPRRGNAGTLARGRGRRTPGGRGRSGGGDLGSS